VELSGDIRQLRIIIKDAFTIDVAQKSKIAVVDQRRAGNSSDRINARR